MTRCHMKQQEIRLKKHLNILYGSQTGNSQAIAEALHDEALQRGLKAWIRPLNAWKQVTKFDRTNYSFLAIDK